LDAYRKGEKMESFSFYNPTRVLFGKGQIGKIGKELKKADIKSCLMIAEGVPSVKMEFMTGL